MVEKKATIKKQPGTGYSVIYLMILKISRNCTSSSFLKIKDVTLSDFRTVIMNSILTDQLYNDLGFTVKKKLLVLVETQYSKSL